MAVKTHTLFYKRNDGEGANICVQIVHFFDGCNALVLPLQRLCIKLNWKLSPSPLARQLWQPSVF